MKRMKKHLAFAAALLAIATLAGCMNPLDAFDGGNSGDSSGSRTGALSVTVGGITANTIAPIVSDFAGEYLIEVRSGASVVATATEPVPDPIGPVAVSFTGLVVGTYDVVVTALDAGAQPVASGTQVGIAVTDGGTTPVAITVAPSQVGTGALTLEVAWPAGTVDSLGNVTMTPFTGTPPVPGTPINIAPDFTVGSTLATYSNSSLSSGSYLFRIMLEVSGTPVAIVSEVVQVYDNVHTDATDDIPGLSLGRIELTAAEINGPPLPPSGFVAVETVPGTVELSWVDESAVNDGYEIQRSDDGGMSWQPLSPPPGPSDTSFADTTAPELTPVQYTIAATNATFGNSPLENAGLTTGRLEPNVRYVAMPVDGGSDTTGNGTQAAPYETIEYAIADLPTDVATTVKVAGGTYTVDRLVINLPVTIEGGYDAADWAAPRDTVGQETVIQGATETGQLGIVSFDVPNWAVGAHGLDGLTIDAQSFATTEAWREGIRIVGGTPLFNNVTVRAAHDGSTNGTPSVAAITVNAGPNGAGMTIDNSTIIGDNGSLAGGTYGVSIASATQPVAIRNSQIRGNLGSVTPSATVTRAIRVMNLDSTATVTIEDNTLIDPGTAANQSYGIEVDANVGTVLIQRNVIHGGRSSNRSFAVTASGGTLSPPLRVIDNTIHAGASENGDMINGVHLFQADGTEIRGNTIFLSQEGGSFSDSFASHGIWSSQSDDLIIVGNRIYSADSSARTGNQVGIYLQSSAVPALVANNVLHHRDGADPTSTFAGIVLNQDPAAKVLNNTVYSSATSTATVRAIELKSTGSAVNPEIINNLLVYAGSGGVASGIFQEIPSGNESTAAPASLRNNAFVGWDLAYERDGAPTDPNTENDLNDEAQTTQGIAGTADGNIIVSVLDLFQDPAGFDADPLNDFQLNDQASGGNPRVAGGGIDLSPDVNDDIAGAPRTSPVSIGAFEQDGFAAPDAWLPAAVSATATSITTVEIDASSIPVGTETLILEVSLNGGATWTELVSGPPVFLPHTNIGLMPGTEYYYRIRARNVFGESISPEATVTTPVQAWNPVGPRGFSPFQVLTNEIEVVDVAGTETPYVAYGLWDGSVAQLAVDSWDGVSWQPVSTLPAEAGSLRPNSEVRIEFIPDGSGDFALAFKSNSDVFHVFTFDHATGVYTAAGLPLVVASNSTFDITYLDIGGGDYRLVRAFSDGAGNVVVETYDGANWTLLRSIGISLGTSLTVETEAWYDGASYELYVAYHDDPFSDSIFVERFDGASWNPVDTPIEIATQRFVFDLFRTPGGGQPYLAYVPFGGDRIELRWHEGGGWQSPIPAPAPTGPAQDLRVFNNGGNPVPYVSYYGEASEPFLMRYDGGWLGPALDGVGGQTVGPGDQQGMASLAIFDRGGTPILYMSSEDYGAASSRYLTVWQFE